MRDDDETPDPPDVVLVGPALAAPGDERWPVLRRRSDRVEIGELRAMREGRPMALTGEVVKLKPRPEHARLFDVEVLADLGPDGDGDGDADGDAERSGPPQVATDAYRAGWEVIFGKRDLN